MIEKLQNALENDNWLAGKIKTEIQGCTLYIDLTGNADKIKWYIIGKYDVAVKSFNCCGATMLVIGGL